MPNRPGGGDAEARPTRSRGPLALVGPGLLVAATGVGAGDLATAGFAGSRFGLAVAWAVVLGAFLKYVLNENLARWQAGTGETVLEGVLCRFPRPVHVCFGIYLVAWSVFVGAALVKACGVIGHALLLAFAGADAGGASPPLLDPLVDRVIGPKLLGVACSGLGVVVALAGGFRWFERVMACAVAVMFATVVGSAAWVLDDPVGLVRGLAVPAIPREPGGLGWTIALLGGVGGTLTILCYAYWMRDGGRTGPEHLRSMRLDLAVAYAGTALFGIAMIVLASGVDVDGRGAALVAGLARRVAEATGPAGGTLFLGGAFAAVLSSLFGVWQGVPQIFADWWRTAPHAGRGRPDPPLPPNSSATPAGRAFLVWIALASLPGLWVSFAAVQQWYAVVGAIFIPLLAASLLVLNRRDPALPESLRNGRARTAVLAFAVVVLGIAAGFDIAGRLG